jgi:hypothetical protein
MFPTFSHAAHEKNEALAREIDTMRKRLQAMGMCGGSFGAPAPTPALSAVPSLTHSLAPSSHASPAKPKPTPRTHNGAQRKRDGNMHPVFGLAARGGEEGGDVAKDIAGNGAAASAVAGVTQSTTNSSAMGAMADATRAAMGTVEGGDPHTKRSLFDKMRATGVCVHVCVCVCAYICVFVCVVMHKD